MKTTIRTSVNAVKNYLTFLVFIMLYAGVSHAAITFIQPNETDGLDSYIRQDFQNSNFGSAQTLFTGLTASGDPLRAVLQFNLSSVTSTDTITSAYFRIFVNDSGAGENITARVHAVLSQWDETGVTWLNRTSSAAWTAGGDFNSTVSNSTLINNTGFYLFDITELIRGWHNGSIQNRGLMIRTNETAGSGRRGFYSSDFGNANERPSLNVTHVQNSPPSIESLSDNSNTTNPTFIGNNVTFTLTWGDLDSTQARIFMCNTNGINTSGCNQTTFCSTAFSGSTVHTCNFTAAPNNTFTTAYFAGVCDNEDNCTISQQQAFSVNHAPDVLITAPNGGETINQSLGNFTIRFNTSDADNHTLAADIFYSESQGARQNAITLGLNLTAACTDADGNISTTNNCSYSWNSTNVLGTFFLDILVNDTFQTGQDSSNAAFNVTSLVDTTAPNATVINITAGLTSGELAVVFANVSDQFLRNVTLEINNSDGALSRHVMTNSTQNIFSANFTVGKTGNYSFRVLANDTTGNLNATEFVAFNVTKPNAAASRESPASAAPGTVIAVRGIINATDLLAGVNATLITPAGFTLFQSNQTQTVGNASAGEQKNTTWFLSVPVSEANYTLNVTFTDQFNNSYTTNLSVLVSQAATGGLFADINSQTEVQAGNAYQAELLIRDGSGTLVNADSIQITLFDSLNNTIVSNVNYTSQLSTGRYSFVYSTSAGQPQGAWLTQASATKGSVSSQDRQFWKLTGGPFDVRNITVTDSTVPELGISAILENTGGSGQDLAITWNLTRTDTGQSLASGGDTVLVPGNSVKTYSISPSTIFVGEVKITIVGVFSGTERAGAFSVFTTVSAPAGTSGGGGTGGGGGGGGGAAPAPNITKKASASVKIYPEELLISAGQSASALAEITNGNVNITNVYITVKGIPQWFFVSPPIIRALAAGNKTQFNVTFSVPAEAATGDYSFTYEILSDQLSVSYPAKISVVSEEASLRQRLLQLKAEAEDTRRRLGFAKSRGTDVSGEEFIFSVTGDELKEAESTISSKRFPEASSLMEKTKKKLDEINRKLDEKQVPGAQALPPEYGIYLSIVIGLVVVFYVYKEEKRRRAKKRLLAPERKPEKKEPSDIESQIEKLKKRLGGEK